MKKAIIFDLDMTLINTHALYQLRQKRKWSDVMGRMGETFPFPGIPELLNDLSSHYQMAIVTSSPRSYAEKVLVHNKINLPVYTAYHDTSNHKPHPDPILHAIGKFQFHSQEIISIGDELKDAKASIQSGCDFVAVTWGYSTQNDFMQEGVSNIVSNVESLRQRLFEQ